MQVKPWRLPVQIVDVAVGASLAAGAAAVELAVAMVRLPAATRDLVVRVDRLVSEATALGAEVGPPLRRLIPLLDELAELLADGAPLLRTLLPAIEATTPAIEDLAPVLREGAPLIRRLVPVLEAAVPALEQLGPLGNELVPVLGDAAPGLRRMVPLLDALDPAQISAIIEGADVILTALVEAANTVPAGTIDRLIALLGEAEVDLVSVRAVGDPDIGMAAVAANTDHLVALLDEFYDQVRGIPGAGALLRRGRRQRSDPAPLPPAVTR